MVTLDQLKEREFVEGEFSGLMVAMADIDDVGVQPNAGVAAANLLEILRDTPPGRAVQFAGISDFTRASLVHIRAHWPGKRGTNVLRIAQLPLYYAEVAPYTPLTAEVLRQRLVFARNTGFLLLGADECLAVVHAVETDGRRVEFLDVWENNDRGQVRKINGIYRLWDELLIQRRIADMDELETADALTKARGDFIWWSDKHDITSPQQVARMQQTLQRLAEHAPKAPPARTARGSIKRRWFIESSSKGAVAHMTRRSEGWQPYATNQDAWYFGYWVNPVKREILSYTEGDVEHLVCDTAEQFSDELADLAKVYGERRVPCMAAYGPDGVSYGFDSLTFLEGEVKTMCFRSAEPEKRIADEIVCPVMGHLKLDSTAVLDLKEGQRVELGRVSFELDLLNPRSFAPGYQAWGERANGALVVHLKFKGDETVHSVIVS